MNVLITGAAGFIGSHITDHFLSKGHTVIGIDNFDPYYDPKIKEGNIRQACLKENFSLTRGDICDNDLIKKLFAENSFNLVIHLAAKAGVRASLDEPAAFFEVNVSGTINLLEAMKENDVKNMLFASTSSIYGNNKKVPFHEDDRVDFPVSPYAASKKAAELICYNYHHLYDFNIFCFRFFTVYGPRQRPEMAIHKFTKHLFAGQEIPFFGNGTTRRDYTFVDDIKIAISKASEKVKGFEIINLGESETTSLTELVSKLEKATGIKAILKKLPMQAGDVDQTFADTSKARELIDYDPSFPIDDGIALFVDWYKKNLL